ncbi:GNAT family N-acetyltransferase [Shivajiella indica]|uniref:GNAT family N-acetyltransferase n=1 Tax=Shivajiella indica TaxID=872115 RepID=A0ABW5B6L5_9BACT
MRNLTIEDAIDFYHLNLDPEVLKFTGDRPFVNFQAAKDFLSNYDQYEKYGIGRLAVINKETLKFMGWCGLKFRSEEDDYDIGFRFFKEYWKRGFATETAKSCLDFGFKVLRLERIIGRAMKENIASIKVLEKIGMTFCGAFDFEGQQGVKYEIFNSSLIKDSYEK